MPWSFNPFSGRLDWTEAPVQGGRKLVGFGPARVAGLGASITNGSSASNAGSTSFLALLSYYSDPAKCIQPFGSYAYPGAQSSTIASHIGEIIAGGYSWVILGPDFGTNSTADTTSLGVYAAYGQFVEQVYSACKLAGVGLIVCKTLPQGSTFGAATNAAVGMQNLWLTMWAARVNVAAVDTYSTMVDTATGYLKAAYDSGDGKHLQDAGHAQLFNLINAVLAATLPSALYPVTAAGGEVTNPALVGAVGAAPAGWGTIYPFSLTGTDTQTIAAPSANDLPMGNWYSVGISSVSGSGFRRFGSNNIAVAAGEQVYVCGYAKSAGTGTLQVLAWNTTATQNVIPVGNVLTNTAAPQRFGIIATVPAGCTQMQLAMRLDVNSGNAFTGFLCGNVFNLTRLGLT